MVVHLIHFLWLGFSKVVAGLSTLDPTLRAPIAISLGAIPGALSRYYLTVLSIRWLGTEFPYGTLFINLTGAFVMGFFTTFTLERTVSSPELRLLIATGFLGSYTTFSTYALDTSSLLKAGNHQATLLYWIGSALWGFILLEVGSVLARKIS